MSDVPYVQQPRTATGDLDNFGRQAAVGLQTFHIPWGDFYVDPKLETEAH